MVLSQTVFQQLSGGEKVADEEEAVADLPEAALSLDLTDFKLPSPKDLSETDRLALMQGVVDRICDGGQELEETSHTLSAGTFSDDMWILLIVRMITRVAEANPDASHGEDKSNGEEEQFAEFSSRQDKLRQALCDYIMLDFPSRYGFHRFGGSPVITVSSRLRLATAWMNEEWYNDRIRIGTGANWVRFCHHDLRPTLTLA